MMASVTAIDNHTVGPTHEVGMAGIGVGMVEFAEPVVVHVIVRVVVVVMRVVTAGVAVIALKSAAAAGGSTHFNGGRRERITVNAAGITHRSITVNSQLRDGQVLIAVHGEGGGKARGLGQPPVLIVIVVAVVVIVVVVAPPIRVIIISPILR